MAEDTKQQQDGSKTLVSFVVGLLIGGMLVWAFSSGSEQTDLGPITDTEIEVVTGEDTTDEDATEAETVEDATAEETQTTNTLPMDDRGLIQVNDQPAGTSVTLESATYPIPEGWIGVRDYDNGQLSFIKGVVRFSAAAGIVPESIPLVANAPTIAGQEYAIVVFSDNGDGQFNSAGDIQLDQMFATFTAQ